jgi:hypothetical protein
MGDIGIIKSDRSWKAQAKHQSVKKSSDIESYVKECQRFDRNQREGQLQKISLRQNPWRWKVAKMVKIYIEVHAPRNIVETMAACHGKPITLIPSEEKWLLFSLVNKFERIRIDLNFDARLSSFSKTQVAMQFYIVDAGETSL